MISAYPIGGKVWLVHTWLLADPTPPTTLPVGSLILTVKQADELRDQLTAAANRAQRHAERVA